MTGAMERRGPDAEGLHAWDGAVFGHRRLSIIDLSEAGSQPMLSADGNVGVVFNGCIYNFLDLRRELESCGYRFRSQCDTEVLVHGYQQWGMDALLVRLRGMFAIAVWDHQARKLFLARDRLGVKPLLYSVSPEGVAFASTALALRAAGVSCAVDPGAVLELFEFGWVSDERVIYANTRKVPAATLIEWHNGEIRQRRYWTLPPSDTRRISFAEAVERTEALILESVRLRLISDVPIGVLLSAGIDSTLVCWAVAKLQANLKAFTVRTPGDPADEAPEAAITARMLNISHEIIELSAAEQPEFQDLIDAYGEPFACPSALAMLRVCRAAKSRVTVLLTGDGGDDVFLGYPHYKNFLLAQRLAKYIPSGLASACSSIAWQPSGPEMVRRFARLCDYATGGLGAITAAHDGLPYFRHASMLGERLADLLLSHREIPRSPVSARVLLSDFLDYERRTRFVAEYMTKVDGGAMHYAMEARSPFLDQQLWEFAASLPYELHLRNGELKSILRTLVSKNVGPDVACRRKRGFTVPVHRWLVNGWRSSLEVLRENPLLEQQGFIRRGSLETAVAKAIAAGNAPVQLWTLTVLEHWLRNQQSLSLTSGPPFSRTPPAATAPLR